MSSLVARIVPHAPPPRGLNSCPHKLRTGRVAHISDFHSHVHAAKDGPLRVACGVRVAVPGPAVATRDERVTTCAIAVGLDNPSPSSEDRSAALKQVRAPTGAKNIPLPRFESPLPRPSRAALTYLLHPIFHRRCPSTSDLPLASLRWPSRFLVRYHPQPPVVSPDEHAFLGR